MRYTALMMVLLALGAAGCRDKQSPPAESQKPEPADSTAAPAGQASEPTPRDDYVPLEPARPPGFFGIGGGSSYGRRKPDKGDRDAKPDAARLAKPIEKLKPKPVKRPPRAPLTPDKQAQNKLKLARLYLANASATRAADKRRDLRAKAAAILKGILSKYGKSPAAKDARELLGTLEAGR